MTTNLHPLAPHFLPGFLPEPDGSDPLFTFVVVMIVVMVLLLGVMYFALHALPEKMGHQSNSAQLQLIGVLSVLALFTHNNAFWVLALLLAAVRIPDLMTPLESISSSLSSLATRYLASTTNKPQPASVVADKTAKPVKPPVAAVQTAQTNSPKPQKPTKKPTGQQG